MLKISKIRNVKTPERGTARSAGIDFFIPNDFETEILKPHERILIPSGVKANIPEGFALIAYNKSGIATKKGLIVGATVCDSDYQGEIHLSLINTSNNNITITAGEKIVQFILKPIGIHDILEVSENELFSEITERNDGGFGSTGTR
jgi:dUTP pyrophosphatase